MTEVFKTEDKGFVLRATRSFEPGEIIFKEAPLVVCEVPLHPTQSHHVKITDMAKKHGLDPAFFIVALQLTTETNSTEIPGKLLTLFSSST